MIGQTVSHYPTGTLPFTGETTAVIYEGTAAGHARGTSARAARQRVECYGVGGDTGVCLAART